MAHALLTLWESQAAAAPRRAGSEAALLTRRLAVLVFEANELARLLAAAA